jgi:uncharacterized protein YukE
MGLFTVIIDELEDALNSVLKQVDVAEQAKNAVESAMDALVGQAWQGEGADAFKEECSEFVVNKAMEILGFTGEFTKGIKQALDFLRELDDLLSNPFSAIGSIFGF